MFKSPKIYLQIFRNKIVAVDLGTGNKVVEQPVHPFSSTRQTIGDFPIANKTVKNALKNLGLKKSFFATKMVVHQLEGTEGGLSQIEMRALRDIAELNGANNVYLVYEDKPLSNEEVLAFLEVNRKNKKKRIKTLPNIGLFS